MQNTEVKDALMEFRKESLDAAHMDTVLLMITGDIREIKESIKAHQVDTREEFRRVRDKMDTINNQFLSDSKASAVNLKEIETRQAEQAKFAGRIAGAIAGFVTALVTSIAAAAFKWWTS